MIENSITSAIGKEEIVGITKRDQELQKLIGCLEKTNNDPRDGDMRKYSSVFNKLAVVDGIVLRRERIVVPQDSKDYPRRKPRNCAYKAVAPRLRVVPWNGRNGRDMWENASVASQPLFVTLENSLLMTELTSGP